MLSIRNFWIGGKKTRKYRIVVMLKYKSRKSIFLDNLGFYYLHKTKKNIKYLFLNKKKIQEWLYNGAIPTLSVYHYLKKFNVLY